MIRQSTLVRPAITTAAVALSLLLHVHPGAARTHPDRAPMTGTPNLAYTPLGETVFDCGTYKGNEAEHKQKQALHLHNQNQVEKGLKTKTLGLNYLYDNVWVIEDDGTLTLSGTNAFDTQFVTDLYTNNGGGVYTTSQVTFNYDGTLGSIIATGDDGAVLVNLPFSFPYAGANYTQMYVSGNGAVSFGAGINPNGFFDSSDFFSTLPKLAPFYMDLDESNVNGGDVRVRSEATKYTVSWINVREYGTNDPNTFQLVLYPNGNFSITYNGVASTVSSITGFHPGGDPPLEEIRISHDLPHVSAAGAAVFEQYYSYPNPVVDEVALFELFYSQFPDDFFQLVFFTNFTQTMAGFANELNIKNDVTGIGLNIFDGSSQYGSNGVLESRCNMNQINAWPSNDPTARILGKGNSFLTIMGQEAGHRWGAFVFFDKGAGASNLMLGRSDAHWSYYADVDHSSLEGGNWAGTDPTYTCPTNIDWFSEIDEYLFGLRTANEVKDMFYISSVPNNNVNARSVGTPLQGANASGTKVSVTVEDIIAAEGLRTPLEADEEHDFRQGFIFLIQQGTVPTVGQLDKVAAFRRQWEEYFEKSCDGRLSCNTSLNGPYPVGVISGEVRDRYSQHIIPEFTARSVERDFIQHVPADGRFIFRYDDHPTRGTGEPVTIIFSAPGYTPDTLMTNINYGETKKFTGLPSGVFLTPLQTGAGASPVLTKLHANHPNPFNPSTTIVYTLGAGGHVRLTVFDAAGRHVRTLVDRNEAKGDHRVTFDGVDDGGRPLASGVYLYRLQAGSVTDTRKMVLLK